VWKPAVPFLDYDLFDRFGGIAVHPVIWQEFHASPTRPAEPGHTLGEQP